MSKARHTHRRHDSDSTTVAAFLLMVVGIGSNAVGVGYIGREGVMHPFWAAASRFLVAAAIFAGIALVARAAMPRGRALTGSVLYGLLSIGGFFGFVYWGLQDVPAGTGGVVLATSPLLTLLFAVAHRQERLTAARLAGAAIVVAGTAVIFSDGIAAGVSPMRLLAILAASACAAEGGVVVKAFPSAQPAARNAIAMAVGAVVLLALMPIFGAGVRAPGSAGEWTAQVYLITAGTVGVFGLYLFVLSRWTASATSYEFVLAPPVGIVLAWWLLDEPISSMFVAGSALVLVGVYFGVLRSQRASAH